MVKIGDKGHQGCKKLEFEGLCNHYNLTERKIDCAGIDIPNLIPKIK